MLITEQYRCNTVLKSKLLHNVCYCHSICFSNCLISKDKLCKYIHYCRIIYMKYYIDNMLSLYLLYKDF